MRRKPAGAKPLDREEQAQLQATTQKEWQEQGYVDQGKAQEVSKPKI